MAAIASIVPRLSETPGIQAWECPARGAPFAVRIMYAVIKTGGKQYRVAKDDVIIVEKLAVEPGQSIEFDEVLLMDGAGGLTVGAPLVDGARVAATVVDQTRGEKILVFKKKRRKNYRRTRGHRQDLTVLRVTDILAKGEKASVAAAPAPKPAAKPEPKEEAPKAEPAPEPKEAAAPPVEAAPQPEPAPEPVKAEEPKTEAPEAAAPEAVEAAAKKPAKKAAEKKPAKKAAEKKPAAKKAAKKAPAKKKPAKKKPS